jgi:predicted N-formylglutamate amidohydrolase
MSPALLLTCEHGGNRVPPRYRGRFRGAARVLASHRAYDRGALELARWLARELQVPLLAATTTRLVVDLNRSAHHPRLISPYMDGLDADERAELLERHYWPHRSEVERMVQELRRRRGHVLHVAVHSFTPVLNGVTRTAEVGLLYDPRRLRERKLTRCWQQRLAEPGDIRVRCNYPYRGTSDGLTTHLRRLHGDRVYAGIELEMNQALWSGSPALRRGIFERIAQALSEVATPG